MSGGVDCILRDGEQPFLPAAAAAVHKEGILFSAFDRERTWLQRRARELGDNNKSSGEAQVQNAEEAPLFSKSKGTFVKPPLGWPPNENHFS